MRPLHNRDWGFETNCFVCEPANASGLRVPFMHDEQGRRVVAPFNLSNDFSGAPQYVHGGMVLALMDEAMAWAAIAIAGKIAVTRSSAAEFARPVRVGRDHEVEAVLTAVAADRIDAEAVVRDAKDRVCATASGVFVPLGAAHAREAIGADLTDRDATFLS
jgi:uncharacterized protein (TIGR00369 family)